MFAYNNSLVLRMAMVDNINRIKPAGNLAGDRPLEMKPKSPQPADLAELISGSQSGSLEAFEQLYNLFKSKVYGLAYNLTRDHQVSEDLTQDIFMKIFSSIRAIDRPELFPAWVYRIALNTCYSHLRREKVYDEKLEALTPAAGEQAEAAFDSSQDDLARAVREALSGLPERLRTVFLLHEVDGLTHEEIAETLGCQVGTSKSQLFKARMKLRKILKEQQLLKGADR